MCFKQTKQGITIRLHVNPGARCTEIKGIFKDESHSGMPSLFPESILKVSIKEAPEKGKANAALLKFLAKTWEIPKARLTLLKGECNQTKLLLIKSTESISLETLKEWGEKLQ